MKSRIRAGLKRLRPRAGRRGDRGGPVSPLTHEEISGSCSAPTRCTRSSPTRPRPSSATSRVPALPGRGRGPPRGGDHARQLRRRRARRGVGPHRRASSRTRPPPMRLDVPEGPATVTPLAPRRRERAAGSSSPPRRRGRHGRSRCSAPRWCDSSSGSTTWNPPSRRPPSRRLPTGPSTTPAARCVPVGRRRDDRPRRRLPDGSGFLVATSCRRSTPTAPTSSGATPAPGPSSRSVCSATIPPSSRSRRAPIPPLPPPPSHFHQRDVADLQGNRRHGSYDLRRRRVDPGAAPGRLTPGEPMADLDAFEDVAKAGGRLDVAANQRRHLAAKFAAGGHGLRSCSLDCC